MNKEIGYRGQNHAFPAVKLGFLIFDFGASTQEAS